MPSGPCRHVWMVGLALLALATSVRVCAAQKRVPEVRVASGPWRPPPPLVTAQSDLVEINAVVRDGTGKPVAGLGRQNFQVKDDGKPRTIAFFSAVKTPAGAASAADGGASATAAAPKRNIALLFDDITTSAGDLAHARSAAERFVHERLGPGDRIAVFTASGKQSLGLTRDAAKLTATIHKVRTHPRMGAAHGCPQISPYVAEQITRYHDSVALAALTAEALACGARSGGAPILFQAQDITDHTRDVSLDLLQTVGGVVAYLGQQPGQRILVFASGGFLTGEAGQLKDDIIQRALRANVVVNALSARGVYSAMGGQFGAGGGELSGPLPASVYEFETSSRFPQQQAEEAGMAELAEATGGLFFHGNNDLTLGFERLGLAPAVHYELGFRPVGVKHDGKFHQLAVALVPSGHGDAVQARRGYFAPSSQPSAASMGLRMVDAMRSSTRPAQDGGKDTAVAAQVSATPEAHGLAIKVHFDAARLQYVKSGGRRHDNLTIIAGLYDTNGRFVAGKWVHVSLALTTSTWKGSRKKGSTAKLSLDAPPGRYQLRVTVGEASDGRFSAFWQAVEVR